MTPLNDDTIRECAEIEGYLGEMLTLRLFERPSVLVAGQKFRLVYGDDAQGRLVRASDGQVFDIEVEVSVWKK